MQPEDNFNNLNVGRQHAYHHQLEELGQIYQSANNETSMISFGSWN
jgi:hypothetical protein